MNLIIVDRDALDVDAVLGAWRQVPQGRANFLHIDVGPGCVEIKICFYRFVSLHLKQRKSNQNMYSRGGQAFFLAVQILAKNILGPQKIDVKCRCFAYIIVTK